MSISNLYWLSVVVNLDDGLGILLVGFGIFMVGAAFAFFINFDDDFSSHVSKKALKISVAGFFICFVVKTFIPSKQMLYTMAAVKVGRELSHNPTIDSLTSKALILLNQKLDEQIEKPKK